jgi:hypothetical protein
MNKYEEYFKKNNIPYLDQDSYDKSTGQLRLQLGGVLSPFNTYGLDVFVPGSIIEACKL